MKRKVNLGNEIGGANKEELGQEKDLHSLLDLENKDDCKQIYDR